MAVVAIANVGSPTIITGQIPPIILAPLDGNGDIRLLIDRVMMCLLVVCMVLVTWLYIQKKHVQP